MPLAINLDVNPYGDDYATEEQANGYVRVLYKPTQAVQARELNTMQAMVQDQIERFGNWSFQSGDIVYGCAINDIPVLPFVYLQNFQSNGAAYTFNDLINTTAVDSANLQARVIAGTPGIVGNYPNTAICYLQYTNAGTDGSTTFSNTGNLTFIATSNSGTNATVAVVNVFSNTTTNTFTTGNAHGISISDGVVYIHGYFVAITEEIIGIVNPYGTDAGNNVVGLSLSENIITAGIDPNLYDNSQGYSNYNAPGADRLQLVPSLQTLDANTAANTPGFVPIATYSDGALAVAASALNPQGTLGAAIAERIYDEAGNYVVNQFTVDAIANTTGNSVVTIPNANTILARIGPGTGYAGGYRVQIQKTAYVNVNRAVTTQTAVTQTTQFSYGGYFVIDEVAGFFNFANAAPVYLYSQPQQAVTTYSFGNVSPSGNLIGQAMARCMTYSSGVAGSNTCQYFLHVFNVQMSNNYNVNQIKSVYSNTSVGNSVGDLVQPGLFAQSNSQMLFNVGASSVQNYRDTSNNNNFNYVYKASANCTMFANGVIVRTVSTSPTGGTDTLNYPVGFLGQNDANRISVIFTANVDSNALTGTIAISSTNTYVVGTSTLFTTYFAPGDQIKVSTTIRTVTQVVNNTVLYVDSVWPSTASGQTHKKSYLAGKYAPLITSSVISGPTSSVQCVNSTSMTIFTGQIPSASVNCIVMHDMTRSNVVPAAKVINKNRFVKIDTTANPRGPWCLGFPDVHQITGVWACQNNSSYSMSGLNVLPYFACDNGQVDTHYTPAYVHCNGFDTTVAPYLLVMLDYFSCNNTPGVGLFHVESYPVDDANTANTSAITTMHFPCYGNRAGRQYNLRDHCDFRPPCHPSANDTGYCDTTNTTITTSCISYCTVNPAPTLNLVVQSSGLCVPSYAATMNTSITYYVPRKDIIYITPDNVVKVLEGVPAANCYAPQIPDNGMPLAVMSVGSYPSLASDEVDALAVVNKNSITTIRDTSTAITTEVTQQRRYTMRDIGTIDARLTNLEQIVSLSLAEQAARDTQIIDMITGLERPKNGIFVEQFTNVTTCDVSNPEFSCGVDTNTQTCRPRILAETIDVVFSNTYSNGVRQTGTLVTLPYSSVPYIQQSTCTNWRGAPACSYGWCGGTQVFPQYTCDHDGINVGSIYITDTSDGSQGVQDFYTSPYNCFWGIWRTVSNTTLTTPPSAPPTTPPPSYFSPPPDVSHLYGAMGQYDITPPQYYCQAHQSFTYGSGIPAAPPVQLNTATIYGVAPFGTLGDGVIPITSFPSR